MYLHLHALIIPFSSRGSVANLRQIVFSPPKSTRADLSIELCLDADGGLSRCGAVLSKTRSTISARLLKKTPINVIGRPRECRTTGNNDRCSIGMCAVLPRGRVGDNTTGHNCSVRCWLQAQATMCLAVAYNERPTRGWVDHYVRFYFLFYFIFSERKSPSTKNGCLARFPTFLCRGLAGCGGSYKVLTKRVYAAHENRDASRPRQLYSVAVCVLCEQMAADKAGLTLDFAACRTF